MINMSQPLFLTAPLHEKIWGGRALEERFDFSIPSDHTGEAWIISGHPNGESIVKNGAYSGYSLSKLWHENPLLFGENNTENRPFPLLVKILDANLDLSVQVHPDDNYAKKHHGELGKTESWYIIDAKPNAEIYYGHNAMTSDEFNKALDSENWDSLLRKIPVKKGDFFYVPAGTLHALGSGTLVLETQQSSDVTYRVFDFDRVDKNSNQKRELHLDESKDVTITPFTDATPEPIVTVHSDNLDQITLVESPYFNVYQYNLHGDANLTHKNPYTLVTMIDGIAVLSTSDESFTLSEGESFILTNDISNWSLEGTATFIVSTPGYKS